MVELEELKKLIKERMKQKLEFSEEKAEKETDYLEEGSCMIRDIREIIGNKSIDEIPEWDIGRIDMYLNNKLNVIYDVVDTQHLTTTLCLLLETM